MELNQFSQWELKNNHFPRVGIRIEKLLNQFPAVGKYKNLIGHPGGRSLPPNWTDSVWSRDPEWALDTWRDVNLFVKSREPRWDFLY